MDDLLERLRSQVELATTPIEPDEACSRGGARRRSRLLNRAAVAALVAVVVGVVVVRSDRTDTEPAEAPAPPFVMVKAIEVDEHPDGSVEVVFVFDGPLPDERVTFTDDIEGVRDPTGLTYTAQGPSGLHVCQYQHWFGDVPAGSVDLLIPNSWYQPLRDDQLQLAPTFDPADGGANKIPGCRYFGGGYVQYSIWGPPSDEPEDIDVDVDQAAGRVTFRIDPEASEP